MHKRIFDLLARPRTGLEILEAVPVSQLLGLDKPDLPILNGSDRYLEHIDLIADEYPDTGVVALLADLVHPVLVDAFEAAAVGDIENDEDSVGLLKIVLGEGEELLLAGGVPDADSNFAVVDPHDLLVEVEANGGRVEVAEGVWGRQCGYLGP